MNEINKKSLVLANILGLASWFWAFLIVGSAFFDYSTNQPILNPNMSYYMVVVLVNLILTIFIMGLYLWKYQKNNPIISEKWLQDAFIVGLIICGINFLLDILFFGSMGRNLINYFFLETTTGYLYPAIILEVILLAYLIYGRDS